MNQPIRKLQIHPGIIVHRTVEIHRIIRERFAEPVVVKKHRGHPVETEAVEAVFLQPELAVRQQKVQNLRLAVIETAAAPRRMFAARSGMEILIAAPVEMRKPVALVAHRMAVHEIHDDAKPHAVGGVDKRLQVVGRTEPRRCGKERRDVITERPVIRMFHNRHQLHRIVTGRLDAR